MKLKSIITGEQVIKATVKDYKKEDQRRESKGSKLMMSIKNKKRHLAMEEAFSRKYRVNFLKLLTGKISSSIPPKAKTSLRATTKDSRIDHT